MSVLELKIRHTAWESRLMRTAKGGLKRNIHNAMLVLRNHEIVKDSLRFNEMNMCIELSRKLGFPRLNDIGSEWTDCSNNSMAALIQSLGYDIPANIIRDAIHSVALDRSYHPVKEYVESTEWDEVPRLDNWLTEYLGVKKSLFSSSVGAMWMISAIARIYDPGCKADCMLVLEGMQGKGKSKTVTALAKNWFTDQISDFSNKDASQELQGTWIVEMAEMDTFTKSAASSSKAFVSRRIDRFRPPFERYVRSFPRQCVFIGTVNKDDYLKDETGGRRYWCVQCSKADDKAVGAIKEQLWAEALARYRDGEKWWIDINEEPELAEEARLSALQSTEEDSLLGDIAAFVKDKDQIDVSSIYTHLVKIDVITGSKDQRIARKISNVITGLREWTKRRNKHSVFWERSEIQHLPIEIDF